MLVTRARHQSAALAEPLEALGARVIAAPVIQTVDPEDWAPADAAIAVLEQYDWIVFTSTNAVDRFTRRMSANGRELHELRQASVAAVGLATAEHLAALGITPALVPEDYRAEGLVAAFGAQGVPAGSRVLLPRAAAGRDILPDALREAGATVDIVPVYRTIAAEPDPAAVEPLRADAVDVVTFTSPSTARHFIAWIEAAGLDVGHVMGRVAAASIGPVTTRALLERGYSVPIEAASSTSSGLVDAIAAYCAAGKAC